MTIPRIHCAWPLVLLLLAGCDDRAAAPAAPEATAARAETANRPAVEPTRPDPHSFANADQVRIRHLALDLNTDFERRVLSGTVTLDLERLDPTAERLLLDTRQLSIEQVTDDQGEALDHDLSAERGALGQALSVALGAETRSVQIRYRTHSEASGLQWLSPIQTRGGRRPFLFTQSQAIHARSWIPLQDTPAVRFTYSARIHTPKGLRAVMSANNDPAAPVDGDYRFDMPQAIPSYLMALAVGELSFQAMSERTGIYAEPEVVADAAREFEDTEAMMQRCEALFGPYRWGRYDLLILPPSFPFGGMENPRLSFITPTVIAGDKSLVALIAHELAHSWSGNLVTNATWADLWLNEGFTVYLESRIMEAVFGPGRRSMEDVLGYQNLMRDLTTLPPAAQRLRVNLADPDDAFSDVPYEKGRLLLVWLENRFGREDFDAYLRGYFDRHAFSSLDTDAFLDDVEAHLLEGSGVDRADLLAWIDAPGLPEDAVLPGSDRFAGVDSQRERWLARAVSAADLDTDSWTVHEWLYFINNLPNDLDGARMTELDEAFDLTQSRNAEIAHSWLLLAIRTRYEPAFERLARYLIGIGRVKLIRPLYAELAGREWGRPLADSIYRQARPGYHPQAAREIDRLLGR